MRNDKLGTEGLLAFGDKKSNDLQTLQEPLVPLI